MLAARVVSVIATRTGGRGSLCVACAHVAAGGCSAAMRAATVSAARDGEPVLKALRLRPGSSAGLCRLPRTQHTPHEATAVSHTDDCGSMTQGSQRAFRPLGSAEGPMPGLARSQERSARWTAWRPPTKHWKRAYERPCTILGHGLIETTPGGNRRVWSSAASRSRLRNAAERLSERCSAGAPPSDHSAFCMPQANAV